jgi:hypothetical protein
VPRLHDRLVTGMETEPRGRDGALDAASLNLHCALFHCWAALVPLLREDMPQQMLDAAVGFGARSREPQHWAPSRPREAAR